MSDPTTVYRPALNVIQSGGSITIVDGDGNIQQIIGTQPDGTVGISHQNAAPPAVVSTPVVTDATLGLTVTWDGLLADQSVGATLNQNTDFETDLTPWIIPAEVTAVQSSTEAHGGTYSAQVTPNGSATAASLQSEFVAGIVAGQTYQAAGWVWLTDAVTDDFSLSVCWYDDTQQVISQSDTWIDLPAAEWSEVLNTFTAPDDAAFAQLVPTLGNSAVDTDPVTQVFYLDDLTLASVTFDTPTDFDHVAVHVSETDGFTPDATTLRGTLTHAGSFPVTPLTGSTEYFVVLAGVNTSGIAGDASTQASGTPSEVVATDIADGIVTTSKLADDAVTQAKIAAAAVGTAQLGDASVDLSKLADGSVDATKLVDGAVTADALGAGAVGTAALSDGSVTASQMAAAAIEAAAIADGAVGTSALAADSVTADVIAAGAVGADQIAADSITAGQIAANAIGTSELAANSVVAGKIAADAVTATTIAAGAVAAGKIAAGVVDATALAADAVTTAKLDALAVTADKIAANAITAGKINAGAVTADALDATLVLGTQIVAGDPAGSRVQLDDTGLNAYDNTGNNTVMIGSDGTASFSGASVSANEIDTNLVNINTPAGGGLFISGTTGGTSINPNPDLISNASNWTATGTTVTWNAGVEGASFIRCARVGNPPGVLNGAVSVTMGRQYQLTCEVSSAAGAAAKMACWIEWFNSSGTMIGQAASAVQSSPNFMTLTCSGTAPVGATSAQVRVGATVTIVAPSGNQSFDLFTAHLVQVPTAVLTSLSNQAGTDANGNDYPAGLAVNGKGTPLGIVAQASSQVSVSVPSTTAIDTFVTMTTATFTAVNDRWYQVSFNSDGYQGTSGEIYQVELLWGTSAIATSYGTFPASARSSFGGTISVPQKADDGSVTVTAHICRHVGTHTLTANANLTIWVQDLGTL